MKIKLVSDLHLEQGSMYDCGEAKDTTLVLAGDICSKPRLLKVFIEGVCQDFKNVIMVAGNHEFYGHDMKDIYLLFSNLEAELDNFYFLENGFVELENIYLFGCTLWSACWDNNVFERINDTHCIKVGSRQFDIKDMLHKNNYSRQWLNYMLKQPSLEDKKKVVITHFPPTDKYISDRFKGNALNEYFYNTGMDEIIKAADYWFWGHTHSSTKDLFDPYGDSPTFCYSNPRGYTCYDEKTGFDTNLIIEV